MESLREVLKAFVKQLAHSVGIYVVGSLLFTYHVLLEKDLACTCRDQAQDCGVYMVLPMFVMFLGFLWVDRTFQRLLKFCCSHPGRRNICCFLPFYLLKALLISLLWPISVLIDGDWYICCYDNQTGIACKDKLMLTPEDKVDINDLMNESKAAGLLVLFLFTLAATVMSFLPWRRCCARCLSNKDHVAKIILGEDVSLVRNTLRETAKTRLTERVRDQTNRAAWGKVFDAAEEVTKEMYDGKSALSDPQYEGLPSSLEDGHLHPDPRSVWSNQPGHEEESIPLNRVFPPQAAHLDPVSVYDLYPTMQK